MRSPLKNPNIVLTLDDNGNRRTFQNHIDTNTLPPGIDIKTIDDPNQPCFAVEDGTIVFVGADKNGANYIQLRMNTNTSYFYVHLHDFEVKVGDSVKAGQEIGHCGNSGGVAPHLHLGKMVNGVYVDFESDLLNNADMPQKYTYEQLEAIVTKYEGVINQNNQIVSDYEKELNLITTGLGDSYDSNKAIHISVSTLKSQYDALQLEIQALRRQATEDQNTIMLQVDDKQKLNGQVAGLKNELVRFQKLFGPFYIRS